MNLHIYTGGREHLKAYRCIEGGGESKFRVFIAYILYGWPLIWLVKVHKLVTVWCPSLQPILSAINTQLHKVAMFLVPLLTPLISNNYITEDSFVIVPSFDCAHYMTSFNTQTLFTNIQLEEETINICADKLFDNKLKLTTLLQTPFWLLATARRVL